MVYKVNPNIYPFFHRCRVAKFIYLAPYYPGTDVLDGIDRLKSKTIAAELRPRHIYIYNGSGQNCGANNIALAKNDNESGQKCGANSFPLAEMGRAKNAEQTTFPFLKWVGPKMRSKLCPFPVFHRVF